MDGGPQKEDRTELLFLVQFDGHRLSNMEHT
jgi:hypothetical protein